MNVPDSILKLAGIFESEGFDLYCVGGCVRDSLLGVEPHDWDLTTNAKPPEVMMLFHRNGIHFHTEGLAFGTVTASIDGEQYEVTTFRKESGYTDKRHPDEIIWAETIEEDLARRDFTINAIAYDIIRGNLVDPYNGVLDINEHRLNTVGLGTDKFSEDALRILRGIRFAIKYDLVIHKDVEHAMHSEAHCLRDISKERITDELSKILSCNKPVKKYFMHFSDIIFTVIPELKHCYMFDQRNKWHEHDVYEHTLNVVDGCDTDNWVIKLAALLHDISKPACAALGEDGYLHFIGHPEEGYKLVKDFVLKNDLVLTRADSDRLLELILFHDYNLVDKESAVKRFLNRHGVDFLNDWLVLKQADQKDHVTPDSATYWYLDIDSIGGIMNNIIAMDKCFKLSDLEVNGRDVMQVLGIKPSKRVGEVLNHIFDGVLDGSLPNERDVLLTEIKKYGSN